MIFSMTGFATRSFSIFGQSYKIEMKSLNHRFMDLKFRLPREWSSLELGLRVILESKIKRGSLELWIEKIQDQNPLAVSEISINIAQAKSVYRVLDELKKTLNLTESITIRDIMSFPDMIQKNSLSVMTEAESKELQKKIEEEVAKAADDLLKMRAQEGQKLQSALLQILEHFKRAEIRLHSQRSVIQKRAQEKVRKKIEQCFEAYSTPDAQMRALMESRIAQEISYALDKLDIEEELTRFKGHLEQIEALLLKGGAIGKKIDFLFQELNREINTLGNKSQDLEVGQEVVQLKMWTEQMREQSLNLE